MAPTDFPYPPHLLRIDLHGARPLFEPEVRAPLLDVLLSRKEWTPQTLTNDDAPKVPFRRAEALRIGIGNGPSDRWPVLGRTKRPAYEITLCNGRRPQVSVKVRAAKLHPDDMPGLFALGDALASAYQPDIGWVQLVAYARPKGEPLGWVQELLDGGSQIRENGKAHAVGGLGMRTYFGPHTLRQITKARLTSLPAPCVVQTLDWGGLAVDLAPDPWSADAVTLWRSWLAAAEHLKPAGFFAVADIRHTDDGPDVRWTPTGADPGGRLREK
jgi:hypothetical protein